MVQWETTIDPGRRAEQTLFGPLLESITDPTTCFENDGAIDQRTSVPSAETATLPENKITTALDWQESSRDGSHHNLRALVRGSGHTCAIVDTYIDGERIGYVTVPGKEPGEAIFLGFLTEDQPLSIVDNVNTPEQTGLFTVSLRGGALRVTNDSLSELRVGTAREPAPKTFGIKGIWAGIRRFVVGEEVPRKRSRVPSVALGLTWKPESFVPADAVREHRRLKAMAELSLRQEVHLAE